MGTSKPLTIGVHYTLYDTPEIKELAAKGHNTYCMDTGEADLVLGPNCWRMTPDLLPYLELALKQSRALRYPKKEKAA